MVEQPRDVTLTVFMEGTANPMDSITTQIALFSRICIAEPLDASEVLVRKTIPGSYKLSFPGCGVSHGLRGTLFAHGLRDQVDIVHGYLDAFVKAGNTVKVNFLGLSRGGIGGLYLAQDLACFEASQVLLNMLLFDPVPGNLVWMASFADVAGQMNANKAMDVAHVRNLGRVEVLYPCEPLPSIAFHAPLLAKFPPGCQLREEVILGCHQGALFLQPHADTCLAFAMIRDFLEESGSQLDTQRHIARGLNVSSERLAELLSQELQQSVPSMRSAHAPVRGSQILRHAEGQYLNRYHQVLLQRLGRSVPHISDPGISLYMLALDVPE
mmetsp:Transcript_27215/g.56464  ORF Transcript_27215/g.56464 Transcript_27215/m.56464 type:complete len:326 (+) Transcript_27215:1-978(+)